MKTQLTTIQRLRYTKLKKDLKNCQRATMDFLAISKEIKDTKLYLEEYDSWEQFCVTELNLTPQHANRIISFAEMIDTTPSSTENRGKPLAINKKSEPNVHFPNNEGQARALSVVRPDKRDEVLKSAASSGPVTAKAITKAAVKIVDAIEIVRDKEGYDIPLKVRQYWERRPDIQEILTRLSQIKSTLKQAQEDEDIMFAEVNFSQAISDLDKVWTNIQCAMPYAVCTQCQGHPETQPKNQCRLCFGRGLISKFRWDRLVPEEIKAMRGKMIKAQK